MSNTNENLMMLALAKAMQAQSAAGSAAAAADDADRAEAAAEEAMTGTPTGYSNIVGSIAGTFSSSKDYAVGDYVLKDSTLYRFTSAHAAGAWTGSDATEVNLGDETSDLKSAFAYADEDITREMVYVRGDNLCRGDNTMTSGYVGLDGTIYSNADLVYSDKIPVIEGDIIKGYNTKNGAFEQRALRFVTAFNSSGNAVSASGLDNGWSYTVPSGITNIIVSIAVGTNYMISTGTTKTQYVPFSGYWKATDAFIGNLLDDYVKKNGQKQVTSDNMLDLIKTDKYTKSLNLFNDATLVAENKYVAGINASGKAYLSTVSGLDTYIIPVDGASVYTFTMCRTAVLISDLDYTAVGSLLSYGTSINTENGLYILFSINPASYPPATYTITKPLPVYKAINWDTQLGVAKTPTASISGAIAIGGTLGINSRSAIQDGEMIAFTGIVSDFSDGFELDFMGASSATNYIKVDASTITVKNNPNTPSPEPHGLSISDADIISLVVEFKAGKLYVSLYANGDEYSNDYDWYQLNGTYTSPQIKSNGTIFTDSKLSIAYNAVARGIWIFGDSYISVTSTARWAYYLNDAGYLKNTLLSGSPGATSASAEGTLSAMLKYGTPKIAVLATGMNDGSDTNGQPPSLWATHRDSFLTLCEEQGVMPILCTIPTVPSVNNEAKNAWVRSSGYRYIDFAKAVGANSSGVWYSGMLSGDNVHPSATGAKALYSQVLIDLPEITIS